MTCPNKEAGTKWFMRPTISPGKEDAPERTELRKRVREAPETKQPRITGDTRDALSRSVAKEAWLKPPQWNQTINHDLGWHLKETPDQGITPRRWIEWMTGSDKGRGHQDSAHSNRRDLN